MNSTPHQTRSGRPAFLLLSVLALLALVCFPVVAQAEESVGPVYDPEVPKVPGQTKKNKEADPKANNSSKEGGAVPVGNGGADGGSDPGGPSANNNPSTPNPSTPGGDASGQDGSGNGTPGGNGQGNPQQELAQGKALGADTSADDSSSPLIPILIAIAVLAAISIGVVVVRQRRQRQSPGAQVSPKAS